MAIKKRKSLPTEDATKASSFDEDQTTARHPHLTGLRQDVYYFVQANQPCTRDDVSRGIGLKSSTCTARVKELIDEGFLIEPPKLRKENRSGVRVKCLTVSDRPAGGSPLDRVRVEIELYIDSLGNYHAKAEVVGGVSGARKRQLIKRQRVTLTAPHPSTYEAATASETVTPISRYELQSHADDIIDGTIISTED